MVPNESDPTTQNGSISIWLKSGRRGRDFLPLSQAGMGVGYPPDALPDAPLGVLRVDGWVAKRRPADPTSTIETVAEAPEDTRWRRHVL